MGGGDTEYKYSICSKFKNSCFNIWNSTMFNVHLSCQSVIQSLNSNSMKIIEKNVYGNILLYPACEKARQFADLLDVKTFSHKHLCKIEAMGYVIENITPIVPA